MDSIDRLQQWLNSKGLNFGRDLAAKLMAKSKIKSIKPVKSIESRITYADGSQVNVEANDLEWAFASHGRNPNLIHVHKIKELDFSYDLKKHRVYISVHGGIHFFRFVLERHDLEQIAAYSLYAMHTENVSILAAYGQPNQPRKPYIPRTVVERMKQIGAMVRTRKEIRQD